uniref:cystathionine gamma-lyase n=1 Tax=Euplotes harpa TaxID=151035 RepID=A0A7S3N5J4_9SPIT|mmetsp:Transcript_23899/g.27521  ORF Transcript_23899/g.27521 Transcript_23899/m.27521 type:complete len:406 (+) Transcript_23899:19-1236(+)
MEKHTKEEKNAHLSEHNAHYVDAGFSTKAIHVGQPPDSFYGSVNMPIHMSSTYAQIDCAVPFHNYDYGRGGNPTREALESCLASIENGKHALVAGSGLATCMLVIHLLKSGDHVLLVDDVYGGTGRYFRRIAVPTYGMEASFIDMTDLDFVRESIKENTKMIWLETPTNPLLKCFDIAAISEICKEKNILLVVDNTFMTPYNQKPLDLGADIVVHSATKYLGGHSDVVMGAAITNSTELFERLYFFLYAIGPATSPMDCYLMLRSLKTLAIRMEKIDENGLAVAKFLEAHPHVEKVYYPMLESHKYYEVHKKQAKGGAGVISFIIKDGNAESSRTFLKSLHVFTLAESLGGVESLAECPALMTHASVPKEHRDEIGIVDGLIRLAVGIEDLKDLTDDIEHAFKAL